MYLWVFWNGVDNACFWSPAYLPHNDWLAPQQNHGIKKHRPIKHLRSPTGPEAGVSTAGIVPFTGEPRGGMEPGTRMHTDCWSRTPTELRRVAWTACLEERSQPGQGPLKLCLDPLKQPRLLSANPQCLWVASFLEIDMSFLLPHDFCLLITSP